MLRVCKLFIGFLLVGLLLKSSSLGQQPPGTPGAQLSSGGTTSAPATAPARPLGTSPGQVPSGTGFAPQGRSVSPLQGPIVSPTAPGATAQPGATPAQRTPGLTQPAAPGQGKVGVTSPGTPGATAPTTSPLGFPGTPGITTPGVSPVPAGRDAPIQTPSAGSGSAPEQSVPAAGDVETPATGKAQVSETLSPIERLLAGDLTDPNTVLRQFGYDLFTRPPTTFAPVTDVPVSADYLLGPGDNINIVLWGGAQGGYQVEVDRNGAIAIPRLGVMQVSGLTLNQLQTFLQQRFAEFYPDFRMAVTMGKLRTILVYVVGEVRQPGAYTVSALSTIVNALFSSGGPTKSGSLRRIQLIRQGQPVHTLDLYNFLLQGDKSQDQTLQAGDTIMVPLIGPTAAVAGNVKRPAIYEIESGLTLHRLFDLAGGVTPLGYLQRVQVERVIANKRRVVVDFDLSTARQRARQDPWRTPIVEGDLVRVFSIIPTIENMVTLEGHVLRPGRYELKPSMRLRDLLPSYDILRPEPFLDYAEIVRYVEPDLQRIVIPFKLQALLAGDPAQNLLLHPQDTVRVYAKTDFVDVPRATIAGEVRQPGTYPLLGQMRVADLVAKAAGITKVAYLERAEILRVTETRDLRSLPFNLEAALRGESEHNLLLHDEDRLVIHNLFEQKFASQVRISGLVHNPGEYPLTEAMRLSDLIFRAGGLQKLAYREKAELTRHKIGQQGDMAIRIELNLGQAIAGDPAHNLLLEDFDHLLVRNIPEIELGRTMELVGEVRFPGVYPIQKGERLSSVLQRAGGFTKEAYPRGAVFTRPKVKAEQEKRLQELLREEEAMLLAQTAETTQGAVSQEEVQAQKQALESRRQLLERLKTVQPDGRLVLQLQPFEQFASSSQDIELDAGDRLVVPETPKYINVVGEVFNRTALIYDPQRTIGDYLQKVGGLRPEAEEDQMYLVQLDGTVISNAQNQFAVVLASGQTIRFRDFFTVQPQPGDTIIVPRRIVTTPTLRNVRDIVQILFQGVSVLGVITLLATSL